MNTRNVNRRSAAVALAVGTAVSSVTEASVLSACKRYQRLIRWIGFAGLGILFGSLTLQVRADPTIYLYAANGTPVDVTSTYSYQQHYLYDALNNPVGTVDDAGRIFSISGQQIGYILSLPQSLSASREASANSIVSSSVSRQP